MSVTFAVYLWWWLLGTALTLMSLAGPVAAADVRATLETRILERINELRHAHGRPALQVDPQLRTIARDYSRAMAQHDFFSHVDPAGQDVGDRVREAGLCYRAVGENLAKNVNMPDPVAAAVSGWMESPGHRDNLLDAEFRQTGIGVWRQGRRYYFTQIFFRAFPGRGDCPSRTAFTPAAAN